MNIGKENKINIAKGNINLHMSKKESTIMCKQDIWKLRSIKKSENCILQQESIRRPKQDMFRMGNIGRPKLGMKKNLELFAKFAKR